VVAQRSPVARAFERESSVEGLLRAVAVGLLQGLGHRRRRERQQEREHRLHIATFLRLR